MLKTEYIKVRLTKSDKQQFEEYCKANNTDISKAMRKLIYELLNIEKA